MSGVVALVERVAAKFGGRITRVRVAFAVHDAEDGGPSWEVEVRRKSPDRRMADETVRGYGATLAEAEADLLRQAEPRGEAALPPRHNRHGNQLR